MSSQLTWWEQQEGYRATLAMSDDIARIPGAIKSAISHNETMMNARIGELVRAQESQTATLLASQERVSEGLGILTEGVKDMANGVMDLGASFEAGFSRVIWQLERQHNDVLALLETLKCPKQTESEERVRWALDQHAKRNYRNALKEFRAAIEIYPYDFTVHMAVGYLLAHDLRDYEGALEAFDLALEQRPPERVQSLILLEMMSASRHLRNLEGACSYSGSLARRNPKSALAHYEHARDLALLGRQDDMANELKRAIELSPLCWKRMEGDFAFDGVRQRIHTVCRELLNAKIAAVSDRLAETEGAIEDISGLASTVAPTFDFNDKLRQLHVDLQRAQSLNDRSSYLDTLEADRIAALLEQSSSQLSWSIVDSVCKAIRGARSSIKTTTEMRESVPKSMKRIQHSLEKASNAKAKKSRTARDASGRDLGMVAFVLAFAAIYGLFQLRDRGTPSGILAPLVDWTMRTDGWKVYFILAIAFMVLLQLVATIVGFVRRPRARATAEGRGLIELQKKRAAELPKVRQELANAEALAEALVSRLQGLPVRSVTDPPAKISHLRTVLQSQ